MYSFKSSAQQYRGHSEEDRFCNRPFACLKDILDEEEMKSSSPLQETQPPQYEETPQEAISLFHKAMSDVIPLTDRKAKVTRHRNKPFYRKLGKKNNDSDVVRELKELIEGRGDFRITDTSEYIEGLGRGVHKRIAELLHNGVFSYQDHLDLHGYCVEDAYEIVDDFLKNAIRKGFRCVLIIHGRGKSSPHLPKLKKNLCKWLSTGYWRKWVIAYTSAKLRHGGAGATYVLLYPRPYRKKKIKKYSL